jgi:hypothetical protein
MLLKDVLFCTPTDHVDFNTLSRAYERMTDFADQLNEEKRQSENFAKILTIQREHSLHGLLSSTQLYIRESDQVYLRIESHLKRYVVYLLSDMLLLFREPTNESTSDLTLLSKFPPSIKLPLREIHIRNLSGAEDTLHLSTSNGPLHLVFKTKEEKESWATDITTTTLELETKSS